jgi:hypothetical protein
MLVTTGSGSGVLTSGLPISVVELCPRMTFDNLAMGRGDASTFKRSSVRGDG